jgi:hypothetical protein
MEIFSPGPIPYPGTYQCPRCNSREVYDSEKTIGVSAMTIDVPGPVNSTIVNVDKVSAKRCRYCNTLTPYLRHPKAQAEFDARKRKNLEDKIKKAGIVLAVIFSLFVVIGIYNGASEKLKENKAQNAAATLESVNQEWKRAASSCGVTEKVWKTEEGATTKDNGPHVNLSIFVEPASDLNKFWNEPPGQSFDCFSEKIFNIKLSDHFKYSDAEIASIKDFDGIRLYDQTFTNGLEKGVLGLGDHLQGYITFFEKSEYDSFHEADHFHIYLSWNQEKIK